MPTPPPVRGRAPRHAVLRGFDKNTAHRDLWPWWDSKTAPGHLSPVGEAANSSPAHGDFLNGEVFLARAS